MSYTINDWVSRIAQRSDLTLGLVHLTRNCGSTKAIDVLLKILDEKKLRGSNTSSGFIIGNTRAVCFQEAPLYSLAQNIYTEQEYRKKNTSAKKRYLGFGLSISKAFAYEKKGRPVIYDKTEVAKNYLPESEWWRIVNFDLSNMEAIIDWSHEREWRVPGDLEFNLSDISIIVPNPMAYRELFEKCQARDQGKLLSSVNGIVQLGMVFY